MPSVFRLLPAIVIFGGCVDELGGIDDQGMLEQSAHPLRYKDTGFNDGSLVNDSTHDWPFVGRLNTNGGHGICTVVLIAPTVALTADHCVETLQPPFTHKVQFNWSGQNDPSVSSFSYGISTILRHPDRVFLDTATGYGQPCTGSGDCDPQLNCLGGFCQKSGVSCSAVTCAPGFHCDDDVGATFCRSDLAQARRGVTDMAILVLTTPVTDIVPARVLLHHLGEKGFENLAYRIVGARQALPNFGCTVNGQCPRVIGTGTYGSFNHASTSSGDTSAMLSIDLGGNAMPDGGDSGAPVFAKFDDTWVLVAINKSSGAATAPTFYPATASWIMSAPGAESLWKSTLVYEDDGQLARANSILDNDGSIDFNDLYFPADSAGGVLYVSGGRNSNMTRAFSAYYRPSGGLDVWAVKSNGELYHWWKSPNNVWYHETVGTNVSSLNRPVARRFGDDTLLIVRDTSGNARALLCNETSGGVTGLCPNSTSATTWLDSTLDPSDQDLDNIKLVATNDTAYVVVVDAAHDLRARKIVRSGGGLAITGSVSLLASNDASKTAGLAVAGTPDHRIDIYYANRSMDGVKRVHSTNGGTTWQPAEILATEPDVHEILAAESSTYHALQAYPRERTGVWFVARGSLGDLKLHRTVERESNWTIGPGSMARDTYETNVIMSLDYWALAIASTGYRGHSEVMYEDFAFLVRYDGTFHTRTASDTNFSFDSGLSQTVVDTSLERVIVAPWSVHLQ